jgi:hypothetical protein
MKKIFLFAIAVLALGACKDPKAEEKVVLDDVIKVHDTIMRNDEQLMHNKMKLDTLLAEAKNVEAKDKINQLKNQLSAADSAMSNWMQKFDPAQKGKTHDEIMNYLSAQKKEVRAIDSLIKNAVNESGSYIKPFIK